MAQGERDHEPGAADRDLALSGDDVRAAYRWILGREAESDAVVTAQLALGTRANLRSAFFESAEFKQNSNLPLIGRHVDAGPDRIDSSVSGHVMEILLGRVHATWTALGQAEPHWSVITSDAFLAGRIEANLDEFYRTGAGDVARLGHMLVRNGLGFPRNGTCIDFGCGVGRLSLSLGRECGSVIGMDISEPHRQVAEDAAAARRVENVSFVLLQTIEQVAKLPACDLIVSLMVLQHNPPPVMAAILSALLMRLNPGGVAIFQLPTFIKGYRFDADAYVSSPPGPNMEMHALPQAELFRLISACSCRLLEIREDNYTIDQAMLSHTIMVGKDQEPDRG